MKNLTLTLDSELALGEKYRLTPNELMFLRTLLILQDEDDKNLFSKYIQVLKTAEVDLREVLLQLQEKEIILKSYKIPKKGESFNPDDILINKNVIKNIYKSSFELGKELFETYPQFGNINNQLVPLRSVSKHFNSLEECYFRYGKCIGWNEEKHNHIIELVKWGKENSLINMSLSSFVINNSWLDLQSMQNELGINQVTIL